MGDKGKGRGKKSAKPAKSKMERAARKQRERATVENIQRGKGVKRVLNPKRHKGRHSKKKKG